MRREENEDEGGDEAKAKRKKGGKNNCKTEQKTRLRGEEECMRWRVCTVKEEKYNER